MHGYQTVIIMCVAAFSGDARGLMGCTWAAVHGEGRAPAASGGTSTQDPHFTGGSAGGAAPVGRSPEAPTLVGASASGAHCGDGCSAGGERAASGAGESGAAALGGAGAGHAEAESGGTWGRCPPGGVAAGPPAEVPAWRVGARRKRAAAAAVPAGRQGLAKRRLFEMGPLMHHEWL